MQRASSRGAVDFLHGCCALGNRSNGLGSNRPRLIAVENSEDIAYPAEQEFYDDIELLRLRGIRVRGDDHLLIVQDAREGHDSLGKSGDSKTYAVAGERTKIKSSVAQRRLLGAHGSDLPNVLVEVAVRIKAGASPERFANRGVAAGAVQSLLGAVIKTGKDLRDRRSGCAPSRRDCRGK